MSRKSARENVFRLVYELLETGERNDFTKELLCQNESPEDNQYVNEIYDSILENFDFLKSIVERYSKDFAFERIYKTDLAAIMISVCEIICRTDVPEKVSVNEAVELSKKYSTEKSKVFVNGILASVISHKEELMDERKDN